MASNKGEFSWVFIVAFAAFAIWAVAKLRGGDTPFSGISNQRGLFGTDSTPTYGGS
jgi:hypothetical protein